MTSGSSQPEAENAKADAPLPDTSGSGTNFFPVTDAFPQSSINGPLTKTDLNWTCPSGLTTETQTWYTVTADGSFIMSQIIYSPVGLWNPQVQMTFKYFNPTTGKKVWKSKNVDGFTTLDDKRSSKSSAFTITIKDGADGTQEYAIQANLDSDVQLLYTMKRPTSAPGWKLGDGKCGGFSYFGPSMENQHGYVVHRFWPYAKTDGLIVIDGQAIEATGQGMFVQAIQGMRPNLVAARWNFCTFQSTEHDGLSALLMEFTTTRDYGIAKKGSNGAMQVREPQVVTSGSVVYRGELIAVVGATRDLNASEDAPSRHSNTRIQHLNCARDEFTGYDAPQSIQYNWDGPSVSGDHAPVQAEIKLDLGKPAAMNGLIDKVDVLAEIPYFIKKFVNYVAGTKPYIYQTLNHATLRLTLPGSVAKDGETTVTAKGTLFEEHTFISQ
ncbi:Putative cell survival pathways protein [Malassezia vespertilionis]|uniref:Putative cell survival pathways protein n=1 Tax=Malassezia vespertilionis TaxID=2020962 RepID=UPI0024B24E86|nr:Putative cell survival pathways protein [Malassezia vespertilionis]WFD05227.1 Putative cell survival pathways protein [Malassezia vespertilionis]